MKRQSNKKLRYYVWVIVISLLFGAVEQAKADMVTIDFDDLILPPSGELLITNQYQDSGVLFSGEGDFSGLVFPEGKYGTAHFGNSSPNIMHMGLRNEATTVSFVIPGTTIPTVATSISFLVGDGDSDSETFTVSFFDLGGNTLLSQTYTTTTNGQLIQFSGEAASIKFLLEPYSQSGETLDDLSFNVVPVPGAVLLGMIGLSVAGIRLRKYA
jgi:hypothetical protein